MRKGEPPVCSHCKIFIVISAPLVPGKRPDCGCEHTSLTYDFRGLFNIPNQSYKIHLPMRMEKKTYQICKCEIFTVYHK